MDPVGILNPPRKLPADCVRTSTCDPSGNRSDRKSSLRSRTPLRCGTFVSMSPMGPLEISLQSSAPRGIAIRWPASPPLPRRGHKGARSLDPAVFCFLGGAKRASEISSTGAEGVPAPTEMGALLRIRSVCPSPTAQLRCQCLLR